jgi:hypothetical protein
LISDDYVEVRRKEIANISEESFAVGNVAKGNFILAKLAQRGAFLITHLK